MAAYAFHDSEQAVYDQPGLLYQNISGLTVGGLDHTTGQSSKWFFIPFRLTASSEPTIVQNTAPATSIPALDMRFGLATGGSVMKFGPKGFPKITLEGTIDVALVSDTEIAPYAGVNAQVSNVQVNSTPMHWIEVLAMFFEGRYLGGLRYDPTYYRDPYGRVYSFPRLVDLTGTYTPAIPQRANFTMQLMLNRGVL